jgi:hypothetical protein
MTVLDYGLRTNRNNFLDTNAIQKMADILNDSMHLVAEMYAPYLQCPFKITPTAWDGRLFRPAIRFAHDTLFTDSVVGVFCYRWYQIIGDTVALWVGGGMRYLPKDEESKYVVEGEIPGFISSYWVSEPIVYTKKE